MAEDHGAPEAGNYLRLGPEVVQRKAVATQRAAQRVSSRTVQNKIINVLGRWCSS